MLADRARRPGANLPAVIGNEEILLAVLAAGSDAFGRADRDLGREPARPRAGRDQDVQLVAQPRQDPGELGLIDGGLTIFLHRRRHQLVRVVAQAVAVGQHAQLPLQCRPVEHAGWHGELQLEPERLHDAFAEDDDLVEPAFVDVDGDVLAVHLGAHRRQIVAGAPQEAVALCARNVCF